MAWRKVNPAGGQKIVNYCQSHATLATVSGIPVLEWPFDFKGRVVAIEVGADSIASTPVVNFRRFDASVPSTSDMLGGNSKTVPADDFVLIDADDADTDDAEDVFEKGDRLLLDHGGGTSTRLQVNVHFAIG